MKYAIIGCGRIAQNHIKAALDNKLNIVAVCDVLEDNIDDIIEKNQIENTKKYFDYKQMILENEIDLISIATESGLHAEIALYCIENNINVIIEKPMAMSLEDADKIIALAEQKKVKVSACHQNRFNVAVQQLREAVERNRFGKISH